MSNIKISTRRYTVKKNEGYGVPSKGLIDSWAVVDKSINFLPILIVDGYKVRTPRKNKHTISLEEIRSYIRNPEREPDEHNLDNFESSMYINQLYALEFYKTLTDTQLFNSIFTRDYKSIQLSFGPNGPDEVEIEETFWDRNSNDVITLTDEDKVFQDEIIKSGVKPSVKSITDMF